VSFGEIFASRPSNKVFHRSPPGFHLVVTLRIRIIDEIARFVIKSNRPRAMDFVPNKSGRFIYKMDPIAKAIFEIDFMALRHWNAIGDNDHQTVLLLYLSVAQHIHTGSSQATQTRYSNDSM